VADDHHHQHHGGAGPGWRGRLFSRDALTAVGQSFRHDVGTLWKEITLGFLLSGFIAQLPNSFFSALFLRDAPALPKLLENALVGPLVAAASFVCSVGNVPLAAVLWSGGIGFGGVIAFIFADLVVLPIVAIYRKYYGTSFALRIVALMLLVMVIAALIVDGLFSAAGLIPHARPTRSDIFGSIRLDYKLITNVVGAVVFAALFALSARRGVRDPVCGMRVRTAEGPTAQHAGRAFHFCSNSCREQFLGDPARYAAPPRAPSEARVAAHWH
jgi:YHS domain-containing protein